MRILLGLLLMLTPAFAIYKGVEEKGHSGVSRYMVKSEVDKKFACTGILIAKDIILAAPPCVMDSRRMVWYYYPKSGKKIEIKPIHAMFHPNFDPSKSQWGARSIGLMRLAKPVPDYGDDLYKTITTHTFSYNDIVTITGFGRSENENALSAGVLRSATLPLSNALHSYQEFSQALQSQVISANSPIASACADTGGGVFGKKDGTDHLIGMIVGNVPPKDTIAGTCGGQTLMIHLGFIQLWLERAIENIRKMEIVK